MAQVFEEQLNSISGHGGNVLVIAPDNIRRERVVKELIHRFFNLSPEEDVAPSLPEKFDAADFNLKSIKDFADSLQNISLFSEKRAVIIRLTPKLNAAVSEQLLLILKQDYPDTLIIPTAESLLKTSKIYKHFSKSGHLIELTALDTVSAKKWIAKELKNQGITNAAAEVVNLIATQSKNSADEAFAMIEKLALYSAGKSLTEKDFFSVFREIPDPKEFDLLDALQQKRLSDAEVLLQQLLNNGTNSFALLSMIFTSYIRSYLIRLCLDKGLTPDNIQKKLAISSSWAFNKYAAVARNNSAVQLRKKISFLLNTDGKLKNKSLGDDCLLGELLQHMAG